MYVVHSILTDNNFVITSFFNFLQDLCQLVNADQPKWLVGMTEMTRTFGLELMESVLTSFPAVFLKVNTFTVLTNCLTCKSV